MVYRKNSALGIPDGSNKDSFRRDDTNSCMNQKDLGQRCRQHDSISNPEEETIDSKGSEPEDKSKKSLTIISYSQRCEKNKNAIARDTSAECDDTPTAPAKPSAASFSVDPNDTNPNSNKHSMPSVNFEDPRFLLEYSATELLMMVDETVAEKYPYAMLPPTQHSSSNVLHSSVGVTSNVKGKKMVVLALEAPVKPVHKQRKNALNSKKIEISSSNYNKRSSSTPKGLLKRYKRPMLGVEGSSSAARVRAHVKKQENVIHISSDGSSEDTISDDRGD